MRPRPARHPHLHAGARGHVIADRPGAAGTVDHHSARRLSRTHRVSGRHSERSGDRGGVVAHLRRLDAARQAADADQRPARNSDSHRERTRSTRRRGGDLDHIAARRKIQTANSAARRHHLTGRRVDHKHERVLPRHDAHRHDRRSIKREAPAARPMRRLLAAPPLRPALTAPTVLMSRRARPQRTQPRRRAHPRRERTEYPAAVHDASGVADPVT